MLFGFLDGVARTQARRNQESTFPEDEIESIIRSVYSPQWRGGQFSLKDPTSWLNQYAKRMGIKATEDEDEKPLSMFELGGETFAKYAKAFYETRIYLGLNDLDETFPICAGSNVGIVGAAGSGKSALALNILRETKKQDIVSVYANLDLHPSRMYEKMLYSVTEGKYTRDDLYKMYLEGKGSELDALVKQEFPNVYVYSKAGATLDDMNDYIRSVQDMTGKPVRLLLSDYFERYNADKSDDTAASKEVAAKIQDLIYTFPQITPITLCQPNKFSLGGGPDTPILNYTGIKGSSYLYQSFRQILALWRPFYNPEWSHYDHYMKMAILKNDLGEIGTFTYNWVGKTGGISEMNVDQQRKYEECVRERESVENQDEDDL